LAVLEAVACTALATKVKALRKAAKTPPQKKAAKTAIVVHAAVCAQFVQLLRPAYEPWNVLRRHVWPRSFRVHVLVVLEGLGWDKDLAFLILSFCGRDWWAADVDEEEDRVEQASSRASAAEVLRQSVCDHCQKSPMHRRQELRRCSRCLGVRYCVVAGRARGGGAGGGGVEPDCQHKAWKAHKAACNAP